MKMRVSREYGETMDLDQLAMADQTRQDHYERDITEQERSSFGEEVVALTLESEDKADEKKAYVKMLGDEIKLANARRRDVVKMLKRGQVTTATEVSTFFDHETLKVHEYNSIGERISIRTMKPAERQTFLREEA